MNLIDALRSAWGAVTTAAAQAQAFQPLVTSPPAPRPPPLAVTPFPTSDAAMPSIPGLAVALAAAAPHADASVWIPALSGPMTRAQITTPQRVAAFLGQCVGEAGDGLAKLSEVTNYTHAERLVEVFPHEFPTVAFAQGYVGNPIRIANRAYANREGNGSEASGDGYAYRGAGIFMLTGRATIGPFASDMGMDIAAAAAWLRTPAGAVEGACWYWKRNKLGALADTWSLTRLTEAVNGPAKLGLSTRIAASNAALAAMGAKS